MQNKISLVTALVQKYPTFDVKLLLPIEVISYLTRCLNSLKLGGNIFISASISKESQAVLSIFEYPKVNEEDTNHSARAPLASFAVHGNHVLVILGHPISNTGTKLKHVSVRKRRKSFT